MFTMLINIFEGAQPAIKRSAPFTAQSVAWLLKMRLCAVKPPRLSH
jgi:hypothetical protein